MDHNHDHNLIQEQRSSLESIAQAFQLSAHVLLTYPDQLTGQLVGRLMGVEHSYIQEIIKRGVTKKKTPWLRPLTHTLDSPGGPLVRTLERHTGLVSSITLTPDGSRVISGSGKSIEIWDFQSGELLRNLEGHWGALAVTPEGSRVVCGSADKTLKVVDLESGEVLHTLEGHTESVNDVAVTPDGTRAGPNR